MTLEELKLDENIAVGDKIFYETGRKMLLKTEIIPEIRIRKVVSKTKDGVFVSGGDFVKYNSVIHGIIRK